MAGKQQGTGKHPHKSSEEPWPHGKADQPEKSAQSGGKSAQSHAGSKPSGSASSSGSQDLKQREYRDEQGNVRHHTRTYMEQHGKKS